MEALSGIRLVHCAFQCGRYTLVAKKQDFVLFGLQQKNAYLKLKGCKKEFLRAVPNLKASVQDGTMTENTETPLEEVSQTETEEEANSDATDLKGSSVEVKFVLEKKCKFGQRFNVVGNDPLFGNWEVESSIPMTWADGDIWTVEVNVPAEKEFEFKFVLTGERGEEVWQPGANRLFQTKVDISRLAVSESWESPGEDAGSETEASKDSLSDTGSPSDISITSETNELQVLVDTSGTDTLSKDEIEKALESKVDGADGHSATLNEPGVDTAPEIPVAELDLAATTAKSMVGVGETD